MKKIIPPVDLLTYAVRTRRTNHLKLFLYLQATTPGHIAAESLADVQAALGIKDRRTIQKQISWLISAGWMGTDGRCYYLRSFKRLYRLLDLNSRIGSPLEPDYFKMFLPWLYASVIGYIALKIKWRRRQASESEGAGPRRRPSKLLYQPVSNLIISRELNVTPMTASRMKAQAQAAGFLLVKKKYAWISDHAGDAAEYKRINEEEAGRIRTYKGKTWKQQPDDIAPLILFKRRDKRTCTKKMNRAKNVITIKRML